MKRPFMKKAPDIESALPISEDKPTDNGNGKEITKESPKLYYTGNKNRTLFVHVMQKGVEVTKPIKTKIHAQQVEWNRKQWYINPDRFTYDFQGNAHQYVDVNDVAVLTWKKDHEDNCKTCGGKMTVDARESRALGRRGVFHAIWGLDNTHLMIIVVMLIATMGGVGAFFWAYSNDVRDSTQLKSAQADIARLNIVIETYQNVTGVTIPH